MADMVNMPFREVFVRDVGEEDKVSISGIVLEKGKGSFVLDDRSGRVLVLYDSSELLADQAFVRVFGRVVFEGGEAEVVAEVVQSLDNVDKAVFRRVKEIISKK